MTEPRKHRPSCPDCHGSGRRPATIGDGTSDCECIEMDASTIRGYDPGPPRPPQIGFQTHDLKCAVCGERADKGYGTDILCSEHYWERRGVKPDDPPVGEAGREDDWQPGKR